MKIRNCIGYFYSLKLKLNLNNVSTIIITKKRIMKYCLIFEFLKSIYKKDC